MSETVLSPRQRVRCFIALVAALAVVATTSSLTWPILAESLRLQGYDESMIGLNAASQFAGIILVSLGATSIIPRLGFFKSILLGLCLVASMLLLLPTFGDYQAWIVLRFVLGIGNSLLFMTGDIWVSQVVDERARGRWIGVYSTVGMAGWAIGPIIGSAMNPQSYWPFFTGLGAILIAGSLILPTRRIDVALEPQPSSSAHSNQLLAVFIVAPTVLLSSGMFGIVEGGLQSFGHLYTMDVLGHEFRSTGYAVIWVGSVASIFFQYPIGWLADKVDRGWLLVGCVATMATVIACMPLLIGGGARPWWTPRALALWGAICLWGGAMGGTYTVGLTLLGERFRQVELVAANAVFGLLFGLGGILGPFIVGLAMGHIGPIGFPISLAFTATVYTLFSVYRHATRTRRKSGIH